MSGFAPANPLSSGISKARRFLAGALFAAAAGLVPGGPALAVEETPFFAENVARGEMPRAAERVPAEPRVVDLAAKGRRVGRPGGSIVTLVSRARDIRYLSAYAYARLVGWTEAFELEADILKSYDVQEGRIFTLRLREGHRWSDGHPFTADDFRYWWDDVAHDNELSPAGLPEFMLVDGQPPVFEVLDPLTVRYTWQKPNPRFLPELAGARDPYIYRPAHYLKTFHAKYGDKEKLLAMAKQQKMKSWAAQHNRLDALYDQTNPDLPTLLAWRITNAAPAQRFVFERNPYYHRLDAEGRQLPYVDRIVVDIAAGGLLAAKANAGEADLLARGLSMGDIPILKEGEKAHGYRTLLWPSARGSEIALYPNLNVTDPVWRTLNRDVRFRRALSLGIDRHTLNNALFFGLAAEGNNTVMEGSPLFEERFRKLNAVYDPARASALLDEIGLAKRNSSGIRLLPDGRQLEIIVETDGEGGPIVDALTLIAEFWREIGVKLFVKPQDRTVLRNRVFSGLTVMTAAQGLDLAIPTAAMPPTELAPMTQAFYSWPKWGQHVETNGKMGEDVDLPAAKRLIALYDTWMSTADKAIQKDVWREMLLNHAENQWSIGTVAGAIQPVVVRRNLRNIPDRAFYSWDPTAMLGLYRIDELFWDITPREAAAR